MLKRLWKMETKSTSNPIHVSTEIPVKRYQHNYHALMCCMSSTTNNVSVVVAASLSVLVKTCMNNSRSFPGSILWSATSAHAMRAPVRRTRKPQKQQHTRCPVPYRSRTSNSSTLPKRLPLRGKTSCSLTPNPGR